jgi:hypothetical protein
VVIKLYLHIVMVQTEKPKSTCNKEKYEQNEEKILVYRKNDIGN